MPRVKEDFRENVISRIQQEPEFASALLDEAVSQFLTGDAATSRILLRDLVNATVGFEELSSQVDLPAKSLHRMLSQKGNPSMNNMSAIFACLYRLRGEGFNLDS